jgi:uncharacterized protein YjbJ (UPF0337 family)
MCLGGKPPQDNSAQIARQQAEEREQRITQGKGKIDEAFGVFTPDYFDKFKGDYLSYYNPQVDEKYEDARSDLRYNLARRGVLDATPGQKAFGDLTEGYDDQRRAVASNALEATNKIRTQVEQNKSDLYSQNSASADPSLSAISAVGRAGSLQTPPSFSPIGDIFSGLTQAGSAYMVGRNQGLPPGYQQAFAPGATLPGRGSGRVVN